VLFAVPEKRILSIFTFKLEKALTSTKLPSDRWWVIVAGMVDRLL